MLVMFHGRVTHSALGARAFLGDSLCRDAFCRLCVSTEKIQKTCLRAAIEREWFYCLRATFLSVCWGGCSGPQDTSLRFSQGAGTFTHHCFLHRRCKCRHSEKGREHVSVNMEVVWTRGPAAEAVRTPGVHGHTEPQFCWLFVLFFWRVGLLTRLSAEPSGACIADTTASLLLPFSLCL